MYTFLHLQSTVTWIYSTFTIQYFQHPKSKKKKQNNKIKDLKTAHNNVVCSLM